METELFFNWLANQKISDDYSDLNVKVDTGAYAYALYTAPPLLALLALEELKKRFVYELNALEEMNRQQEEQEHANNWH